MTDKLGAQPTILIVEDDDDSRLMLKTLLEMKGYKVIEASNGVEATEVVTFLRPGMLIMDLQLPKLHGFAVTRHMRQREETRDMPIIILSGHDPQQHRPLALAAGCNEYLTKPIDFDKLDGVLSRFLPLD
ncbi:MAG TPA: response regulator [Pyrinomonadaceae bacterium]|nr:response regulator [Pyrinomonadaceae bacterium]